MIKWFKRLFARCSCGANVFTYPQTISGATMVQVCAVVSLPCKRHG